MLYLKWIDVILYLTGKLNIQKATFLQIYNILIVRYYSAEGQHLVYFVVIDLGKFKSNAA